MGEHMLNRSVGFKIGDDPENVIYKIADQNTLLDRVELILRAEEIYTLIAYLTEAGQKVNLSKEFEKMGFKQINSSWVVGYFKKNDNSRICNFLNMLKKKCVFPRQLRSALFKDFKLEDPSGIDKAYTIGASAGSLKDILPKYVGKYVGSFLNHKEGGRLAQTRASAKQEADESVKQIQIKPK